MTEWDLTTNQGRTADFLREGLKFEVEVDGGILTATRHHKDGASVRYVIRFEDENTIHTRQRPGYFTLPRRLGGPDIQTKRYVIVTEELQVAIAEYEERRAQAQGRGVSELALSRSRIALRGRELLEDAQAEGVTVLTFRDFLRSFLDVNALERESINKFTRLRQDRYVEPTLLVAGTSRSAVTFIKDTLQPRGGDKLIVIHAPGGRGKTALAEYITWYLFGVAKDGRSPLPFLIKFEDHRDVIGLDGLVHATLKDYGLEFDLGAEAVDRLIKYGLLVLIFDGFDELSEKAGEQLRRKNVGALAPIIYRSTAGRIVLTSRTMFLTTFPKLVEELERESETRVTLVELEQFDDYQVRDYLVYNTPTGTPPERHRDRVLTFLQQQGRLADLAREPLTLGIISELVGEARFALPRNLAEVYEKFLKQVCNREILRHDLPADLPQDRFLAIVAQDMIELGEFTVERSWLEGRAEEVVDDYSQGRTLNPDARRQLVSRLADHYMFAPESITAGADVRFRHPSFRDFLVARTLKQALGKSQFLDVLSAVEFPVDVFVFLGQLLEGEADAAVRAVRDVVPPISARPFRNLVRLLVVWDRGNHFREVLRPPSALQSKPLQGLVFEEIDLTGYVWQGTDLDGAIFRDCDLSGCNLGAARWRELRFENCSLEDADLGEDDRLIVIDGQALRGDDLATTLRSLGARGPGVRQRVVRRGGPVPVRDILVEVFKRIVEGNGRESIRVTRKLPRTFERGRLLAQHRVLVRDVVLPALQADWADARGSRGPYLVPSGDRHGTITLARERIAEVVDFLFAGRSSEGIEEVIAYIESKA
jgi:hypothetical protein